MWLHAIAEKESKVKSVGKIEKLRLDPIDLSLTVEKPAKTKNKKF